MKTKTSNRNITYKTRRVPIKFMSKEFSKSCSKRMMMFYIKGFLKQK